MIACAHFSCCVTPLTHHGSHRLQRICIAFRISSDTSILHLMCASESISGFREKQDSSLPRHTESLQQMASPQEPGLTCRTVARNPPEGPTASRCATTQHSYWVRWRPEASCAYRPLANGGDGVVNTTVRRACARNVVKVKSRATSPISAIRRCFGVLVLSVHAPRRELFQSMQKQFVGYFRTAWALFYQNSLRRMTKVCNTGRTSLQHSMTSEVSLGALCCRSSPLLAMRERPSASNEEVPHFGWHAGRRGRKAWLEGVAEECTVPQLRRLLQMGAVIGWLQRNSSRSEEGGVSWPGRRVSSSRSSEGRVLGPRIG